MKKLLFTLSISIFLWFSLTAQVPQQLNYQAVVRNAQGAVLPDNTPVSLRFTIHDATISGTVVFTEVIPAYTNQFGLVNVQIGSVQYLGAVNWGSGPKFLQVETDINNAGSFVDMGTSQLVSVPYALKSETTASSDVNFRLSNVTNGTLDWYYNSVGTTINFGTEDYDLSNNAYMNTFTAPSAGIYHFDVILTVRAWSGDVDNYGYMMLMLFKNFDVFIDEVDVAPPHNTSETPVTLHLSTNVKLMAGEFVYCNYDAYASPSTNPVHNAWGSFSGYKVR